MRKGCSGTLRSVFDQIFFHGSYAVCTVSCRCDDLAELFGTDIACGNRAGVDTAFVLSGEGTLADLAKGQGKPTYIFENIAEVCKAVFG